MTGADLAWRRVIFPLSQGLWAETAISGFLKGSRLIRPSHCLDLPCTSGSGRLPLSSQDTVCGGSQPGKAVGWHSPCTTKPGEAVLVCPWGKIGLIFFSSFPVTKPGEAVLVCPWGKIGLIFFSSFPVTNPNPRNVVDCHCLARHAVCGGGRPRKAVGWHLACTTTQLQS